MNFLLLQGYYKNARAHQSDFRVEWGGRSLFDRRMKFLAIRHSWNILFAKSTCAYTSERLLTNFIVSLS